LVYYRPLFLSLPKFKKTTWIFDNFRLKNAEYRKQEYLHQLPEFYKNLISGATIRKEQLYDKAGMRE